MVELPTRPSEKELVRRTLDEESGELRDQLVGSRAERVVTLGQEAADVFAALTGTERMQLKPSPGYGTSVVVNFQGCQFEWIPLTHPGNRNPGWKAVHRLWVATTTGYDANS